MTGRNGPCPCGSGKKYKRCCANAVGAAKPLATPLGGTLTPSSAELDRLLSLARAGNLDQLEIDATALARRYPASGPIWKLLGLALWRLGKDPLPALRSAVRCSPDDAEAASNLGNALRNAGKKEEALAAQQRALTLAPGYALAHNNLGSILQDLQRWEEAAQSFHAAVELDPAFVQAHCNFGNVLLELARPAEAAASYQRALDSNPNYLPALIPMGAALRDLGELEGAAAAYERALALKPTIAELHYNLASVRRLQNQSAEAESSVRTAIAFNPALVAALVLLARLKMDRGRFTEAEELLQSAITIEPESTQAWSAIPSVRRMTVLDAPWQATAERLAAGALPARREVSLRYALGKYFDDVGNYPRAFGDYRRANLLAKTLAPRHDRALVAETVGRIIEAPVTRHLGLARGKHPVPIFIIGMPRSGTSLLEQILASHPSAFGAGELSFWGNALRTRLAGRPDVEHAAVLSQKYRQELARLAGTAKWVTDKMPTNFLAVGLILEALPDARFIHVQRNPIDTCLSLYFQDFEFAYSYANDLGDLEHSYRQYLRIMAHWRAGPAADAILEVPYEQLVSDQEHWTRRMLEFVGLPFDSACLDFHQTDRTVTTVSSWQVRQSMHTSSVGRWRNYEEFLGPLSSLIKDDARGASTRA